MVTNPLQDIPYVFRIEKADRQPHQFGYEVGNQGDAYPGVHVKADPALDEAYSHLGNRQHQLRYEYQRNKVQIIVPDTLVHHSLGQERKDERENTAQQHSDHKLEQLRLVGEQVAQVERKVFLLLLLVVYAFVEFGGWGQ